MLASCFVSHIRACELWIRDCLTRPVSPSDEKQASAGSAHHFPWRHWVFQITASRIGYRYSWPSSLTRLRGSLTGCRRTIHYNIVHGFALSRSYEDTVTRRTGGLVFAQNWDNRSYGLLYLNIGDRNSWRQVGIDRACMASAFTYQNTRPTGGKKHTRHIHHYTMPCVLLYRRWLQVE